jgi:hypothetical protein
MNTNKVMLATLVATAVAMAFAVMPALITQASADPAPKTVERCDDPRFADRTSCPGESENAASDKRDDECIARNNGQAKQNNCEETAIVNPG